MSRQLFEQINLNGHIELEISLQVSDDNEILDSNVFAIGGYDFLQQVEGFRQQLSGSLSELKVPQGNSTGEMLLREMILKIKGEWKSPYTDPQLCHCRAIATEKVEQAILYGAHTPEKVSQMTSASTACGTCREDVESLISYRKKSS